MLKHSVNIISGLLLFLLVGLNAGAQQPSIFRVSRLDFNSGAFNEISPVIVKDGIVFCSDRRFSAFKDRTTYEGERLYNIYRAERTDTIITGKPRELKSERSMLFNNGPLCFAPDGRTVYFTSEVETGKAAMKRNFRNHSGIFIAVAEGEQLTGLRPFPYNSTQYDVGHPSISADGKYLFFASDMPGGSGGSDLWYCEFINNEWSKPVNLGPKVNSQASENYPFIHPSGRLYFSSNRGGGNGKLDVWYTNLYLGAWDTPTLLPPPINSPSDDFAFVADETLQTGYFASNRMRTDDIFKFSSTIIRKSSCDTLQENNYCYEFFEENALKYDTIPFRYEWKFGDGSQSSGKLVEHCYSGPGSYLVQLDVVNLVTKEVFYNQKTFNLQIKDIEQPYIGGPDTGGEAQRLIFSADSTNLPGWDIARYYWNFGDETVAIGKEVDKVYMKPGTYNIQLIVSSVPEPGGVVREACVCKNITIARNP